jgi:hypothetical protein
VKLIRHSADQWVFRLGTREKELLLTLLNLYPRIPPGRQTLRRTSRQDMKSERLLEEALTEHRQENKKQLQALLNDSARLSHDEHGWKLSVSPIDLEWLLQVLNEVRVGSWLLLGCPETLLKKVDQETAPHLWAMEMAGSFQMLFLELLQGRA